MSQDFFLDQKKTTVLVTVFLVLLGLVFIAGYLSGIIVGLPEPEQQPVVKAPVPVVKPQPAQPVVAMRVPQVDEEPEAEVVAEIEEPEPEEADIPEEKLYSVQVGSFMTNERAASQVQGLLEKGYEPYIYHGANSKGALWYTVRIADFADVEEAIGVAREFRSREGSAVALTHYNSLMLVKTPEEKRIEIEPFENTALAEEPVDDKAEGDDDLEAAPGDEAVEEGETVEDEDLVGTGEVDKGAAPAETQPDTDTHITFAIPEKPTEEGEDAGSLIASAEANRYSVQVGAFLKKENADKFAEKLKGRGYPAYVFHYTDSAGNAWNAVRAGDFPDLGTAHNAAVEFQENENISAIVTKIDAISMIYVK